MSHGSHSVAEADLGSTGDMPSPYCKGPWKQWVMAMGVTSVVALAISVEEHYRIGSASADATSAVEPGPPDPTPMAVPPADNPLTPVARVRPALGDRAAPNVLSDSAPAPRPRTPFNEAARSIRPSVVGVRAQLTNGTAPSGVERVGSGVIVDSSGYTVTCHHVVVGATAISVSRFEAPDQQIPARLVAVDADLALLKFQFAAPLPAAPLADSDQVQVGDWVLAVGHPFGLGLTVTSGIVGRRDGMLSIRNGPRYTELLQTDAPINEGSSGGPLVNLAGEVIGLNTAIYAPTGVFSGAGFAIPSNVVRQFLARYLTIGSSRASAGRLAWGMAVTDLSGQQREALPGGGALVIDVEPGSVAQMLRVEPGDVVVGIGTQPVPDAQTLRRAAEQPAVAPIRARVWRQGQLLTLTLDAPNGGSAP
jgi:serine protease Do